MAYVNKVDAEGVGQTAKEAVIALLRGARMIRIETKASAVGKPIVVVGTWVDDNKCGAIARIDIKCS